MAAWIVVMAIVGVVSSIIAIYFYVDSNKINNLYNTLNAAYYTKPGADVARVTSLVRAGLMPGDERGLHVHGWKSLFEAAGSAFKDKPSFWGPGYPLQPTGGDMGHEVEIGAYSVSELRAVLRLSRAILGKAGLPIGIDDLGGETAAREPCHQSEAEGRYVRLYDAGGVRRHVPCLRRGEREAARAGREGRAAEGLARHRCAWHGV